MITETGFDRIINDFRRGEVTALASRPAVGKTTLALNLAEHMAVDRMKSVLFFTLEAPAEQLFERIVFQKAGLPWKPNGTKKRSAENNHWIETCAHAVRNLQLCFDDTPMISAPEIDVKCKEIKAANGLDFVVLDYLQLMEASEPTERRFDVHVKNLSLVKQTAQEVDCPFLILMQLSRASGNNDDIHEMESLLRPIFDTVDQVMIIHRRDNRIAGLPNDRTELYVNRSPFSSAFRCLTFC